MSWQKFVKSYWYNQEPTTPKQESVEYNPELKPDTNEDLEAEMFYDCLLNDDFSCLGDNDSAVFGCGNGQDLGEQDTINNNEGKILFSSGSEEEGKFQSNSVDYTKNVLVETDDEELEDNKDKLCEFRGEHVIQKEEAKDQTQLFSDSGVGSSSWSESDLLFTEARQFCYGGNKNCFTDGMEDVSDHVKFLPFEDDFGFVCPLSEAGQYVNYFYSYCPDRPQWGIPYTDYTFSGRYRVNKTLSRVKDRATKGSLKPSPRR